MARIKYISNRAPGQGLTASDARTIRTEGERVSGPVASGYGYSTAVYRHNGRLYELIEYDETNTQPRQVQVARLGA